MRDWEFDALLDEHQEREAEMAAERAERGDIEARRPDAQRQEIPYSDLLVGDYMTAEGGADARWVEVAEIKPRNGKLAVTFKTPQPLGVGLHDRWVIDQAPDDRVVIDANARKPRCEGAGEIEVGTSRDEFGNWDTETYECPGCPDCVNLDV